MVSHNLTLRNRMKMIKFLVRIFFPRYKATDEQLTQLRELDRGLSEFYKVDPRNRDYHCYKQDFFEHMHFREKEIMSGT